MKIPLQVSSHGIALSDTLRKTIRKRAQKLERYYGHLMSCRVVFECEGRHQRKGQQYNVRVDLKVPGGELAVTREHDEDLQIALRGAFEAVRRQLKDYSRVQRGR